ncbi:MAG: hypothetical protein R3270_00255 [Gammaproteobacteria bacterium]|nr:hypothetical protein [Gammaproteobacteria bacterium]
MNTNIFTTQVALMKRELWEHKGFWMVPFVMAAVLFVLYLYSVGYILPTKVGLDIFVDRLMDSNPEALRKMSQMFVPGTSVPFLIMMGFVIPFYLLDSLYAERRDRSILFWKSLPITDASTVMSKWLSVFITFPAIVLATVGVLSIAMTLVMGIIVIFGGGSAWTLVWSNYGFFNGMFGVALLLLVQLLWYLPLMSWLMLASAWAKKAPFLWATLPPAALIILEEMFLDSNEFVRLLGSRLIPFGDEDSFNNAAILHGDGPGNTRLFGENVHIEGSFDTFSLSVVGDLFTTPEFWTGAIFAAACTAGAIALRRYRDES